MKTEQFENVLIEIVSEMTVNSIISYPGVMDILREELNNDVLNRIGHDENTPIFKEDGEHLIPVHINKCRCDKYYWDWSSDHGKWIRGKAIS